MESFGRFKSVNSLLRTFTVIEEKKKMQEDDDIRMVNLIPQSIKLQKS